MGKLCESRLYDTREAKGENGRNEISKYSMGLSLVNDRNHRGIPSRLSISPRVNESEYLKFRSSIRLH